MNVTSDSILKCLVSWVNVLLDRAWTGGDLVPGYPRPYYPRVPGIRYHDILSTPDPNLGELFTDQPDHPLIMTSISIRRYDLQGLTEADSDRFEDPGWGPVCTLLCLKISFSWEILDKFGYHIYPKYSHSYFLFYILLFNKPVLLPVNVCIVGERQSV